MNQFHDLYSEQHSSPHDKVYLNKNTLLVTHPLLVMCFHFSHADLIYFTQAHTLRSARYRELPPNT